MEIVCLWLWMIFYTRICFILQNRIPVVALVDHPPLLFGSLISVRGKASTPINTVIMFVPQQEVNMDVLISLIRAVSIKNSNHTFNYGLFNYAVSRVRWLDG
jgi:hypothetical protein